MLALASLISSDAWVGLSLRIAGRGRSTQFLDFLGPSAQEGQVVLTTVTTATEVTTLTTAAATTTARTTASALHLLLLLLPSSILAVVVEATQLQAKMSAGGVGASPRITRSSRSIMPPAPRSVRASCSTASIAAMRAGAEGASTSPRVRKPPRQRRSVRSRTRAS